MLISKTRVMIGVKTRFGSFVIEKYVAEPNAIKNGTYKNNFCH
jgi:hypothetical protein